MNSDLCTAIWKAAREARALDPGDQDAVIEIGGALEAALELVPDDSSELAELLETALAALRQVFQRTAADPAERVEAIGTALVAAEQMLAEEPGAEQQDPEPNPEQTPPSFDDVAASIVQLEPDDLEGCLEVAQALAALAEAQAADERVRDLVYSAAERIRSIGERTANDPAAALVEAGELVQEAMQGPGDDPAPAEPAAGHADALPPDADKDLLAEFIIEAREDIEAAEAALLNLETDRSDSEAVNVVFRAFHTIKGTSAFLGLTRVTDLAHSAETLLSRVRDGEIQYAGGYADLALRSVDMLSELLQGVEDALGGEPLRTPAGYEELAAALADPEAAGVTGETDEAAYMELRVGDLLVAGDVTAREDVDLAAAEQGPGQIGEAVIRSRSAGVSDVAKALRTQQRIAGGDAAADGSVRVPTRRLDKLIEMVGELVIAQAMINQDETVSDGRHPEFARKVSHGAKIVRELQDLSMAMRMVPLKATFQKMARIVRDMSRKSGKVVQFVVEGEDTEIDRNMVDAIGDPLVHMVRNAVDHGIASPEARERAGKPKSGAIVLSACHAGGSVVVELRDDGEGLNRQRIVAKAMQQGLIGSDRGLSDHEMDNLIFEPGFSTAESVTDVSGRGVGLDVVKRNIAALRGRAEVSSEPGKGCTFRMRLPLTLAVTDGMLVKAGDERYIVPTLSIENTFQPDRDALSTVAERGEMVRHRDEMLPLFRLHRLFRVPDAVEDPTKGLLAVLHDGRRRYALLVDELLGQHQVVAKSLGEGVGQVQGVAGAAILGDGRVGVLLDPIGLGALARETSAA